MPTDEEGDAIQRDIFGAIIDVTAREGIRLSDLPAPDSYSFELADIFIGADDEAGMRRKYVLGFVVKGLVWLAIIGIVLFVVTAGWGAVSRRPRD